MGIFWSQPEEQRPVLDGLGFPAGVTRDFEVKAAREKLEQLLRGSLLSHRSSDIAQPLTAAFFLGASPQELTQLYEKWVPELCEPWPEDDPVGDSIGKFNLDEFFGQQKYEQRYYEYFRDCLTEERDWPPVVKQHMEQLGPRLARNRFRPLLELAAALESDNPLIAAEALGMACTDEEGPELVGSEVGEVNFLNLLQTVARYALKSGNSRAICIAQAQCEIFLSEKQRLVELGLEISLLQLLKQYIDQDQDAGEPLPTVSAAEALESKDARLIQYTRARIVLEKIAI